MIYRELNIPQYNWLVHVFYHVTCYWTDEIMDCLKNIGCPPQKLKESYRNLKACKLNTGLTYSNYYLRESVMVIGKTSSSDEFSDSMMHELRHLEDHIATAYKMPAGGEEIAYLAGYIGYQRTCRCLFVAAIATNIKRSDYAKKRKGNTEVKKGISQERGRSPG